MGAPAAAGMSVDGEWTVSNKGLPGDCIFAGIHLRYVEHLQRGIILIRTIIA